MPIPSLRSFGARLAALPSERVLNTEELAQLFGVNHNGITRAVKRGDLPPPAKIFGCHIWTVRVIRTHIDALLEQARIAAERARHRRAVTLNTRYGGR